MISCNDGPILTLQNQVLANSPGKGSHMRQDGFSLIQFVAANYKTEAEIMCKVKFGEGENGKI